MRDLSKTLLSIPALPPIEASCKRPRLSPLTIQEYQFKCRETSSDFELIERVFYDGIACDQLRAILWPYLFGLVKQRGSFKRVRAHETNPKGCKDQTSLNAGLKSSGVYYVYIEHPDNISRWIELADQYKSFQNQWKSISADQEARFSTFRERKSQIERDVVRCDRLHPFFAGDSPNLNTLTDLLMTYMMYDFDIGYVQGMSDLAGPILYLYNGDLTKSFWVFVELMKQVRRNFEHTQKTVHFQLDCLHELIRVTDPVLSHYLEENESSNCFFAFRAIVCLFKRELMSKDNGSDYSQVLHLWDSVLSVNLMRSFIERQQRLAREDMSSTPSIASSSSGEVDSNLNLSQVSESTAQGSYYSYNPNQSDTPRNSLTETEVFVLALCLSMIRSERDLILGKQLDCTDIHLHFLDSKLSRDLNGFVARAINIYTFLKCDFDLRRLTCPKEFGSRRGSAMSAEDSYECYDLLSDFLIINEVSGSR